MKDLQMMRVFVCHRPPALLGLLFGGVGAAPAAEDLGQEDAAETG